MTNFASFPDHAVDILSHIASKINNGVLVVDTQGAIIWSNESFNAFTGYTLAQTIGRLPGEVILDPQETGEAVLSRMRENLKKGLPFSEDVVLRNKIGGKRWFTAEATPVAGNSPAELKTYIILTDITERKQTEEKLQQQAEDLFRRNRDLQQFTYIVSHNLRAPVANTLGLANMLRTLSREGPLFEEVIEKLHETALRLDTVIRDLSTLVSFQDKSPAAVRQPVLLSGVIQQVAASLQTALQEADGKLQLLLAPEVALDSNKAYLYSIFYNLVSNAIKYRSKNRPLEITIKSFSAPAGALALAISDNGTGMDLAKVGPELFKLYKRFNTTVEGKGMGLFLVKTQVEALGGRIEVSSQPGVGTTFTLFFKVL